jgi:putative intracellular protease/amidase
MSTHTPAARVRRVLMVVASPAVSTTLGIPVGFWASELTHAWYEFREAGYEVTIASPAGGRVELDAYSDPRDASGYSAHDVISMGFLHTPALVAMLDTTRPLAGCREADFDALVVAGGQSPMFTFVDLPPLQSLIVAFHDAGKPTAALCHGTAALLRARRADGTALIAGRTMTGFANIEEDEADRIVGTRVMPFRIEDEARALGANFVVGGLWKPFAVRDGQLITGQQQYSGRATAALVVEALGR